MANTAKTLHLQLVALKAPVILVGWSLGGTIAIRYAQQYPQYINGVITLATNVSFVQTEAWDAAMTAAQFEKFCQGIQHNSAVTLQQFALMCGLGSPSRKAQSKWLQRAYEQNNTDTDHQRLQALLRLLDYDLHHTASTDMPCDAHISRKRCPCAY